MCYINHKIYGSNSFLKTIIKLQNISANKVNQFSFDIKTFFFFLINNNMVHIAFDQPTLQSWNGQEDLQITQTINITLPFNPLFVSNNLPIIVSGPTNQGASPVNIIVNNSNTWNSLFNVTPGAASMSIQNLGLILQSCTLTTSQSLSSAFLTFVVGSNPNVSWTNVAVEIGSNVSIDSFIDRYSGFMCGLNPFSSAPPLYSFLNCTYTGPIFNKSGSFVATGYTGGGGQPNPTTLQLTNCVANIVQRSDVHWGDGGGLIGNQSRFYDWNINNCVVYFTELPNYPFNSYVSGFLGDRSSNFTISNSYVLVTDSTVPSNSITLWLITNLLSNNSQPITVNNSWFLGATFNNTCPIVLNTYSIEATATITISNCAFQNGFSYNTQNGTFMNDIFTYTFESPTTIQPFTSWNQTTIWIPPYDFGPLILQSFQNQPFSSSYLDAFDIPTLSDLCIFEGTQMLTTKGYVKVEDLTLQHRLITWDNREVSIRSIISHYNPSLSCLHLPPHWFGENLPSDDVYLSMNHAIFVHGHFIHASHGRESHFEGRIQRADIYGKKRYYCIETEDYYQDLLIASGLAIEGFTNERPNWDCSEWETNGCILNTIKA